MNAAKSKNGSYADKMQRERYGRWLGRKTPSIDEWGDIHMWMNGEPIDEFDDVVDRQQDEDAWMVIAADYEENLYGFNDSDIDFGDAVHGPVEDHDLAYGDSYRDDYFDYDYDPIVDEYEYRGYWPSWDTSSISSELRNEEEIQDAWDHRSRYVDSWTINDEIEQCWREHELSPVDAMEEARFDVDYYLEFGPMPDDEEIDLGMTGFRRENATWTRDHYLFGMHLPPKR